MSRITLAHRVRRSADQVWSDLGVEVVVLTLSDGFYYSLEGVGARIWNLLERETAVSAIHARLVDEFDVTSDRCRDDVLQFLDDLRSRGLLEVAAGGDRADER